MNSKEMKDKFVVCFSHNEFEFTACINLINNKLQQAAFHLEGCFNRFSLINHNL